MLSLTNDQLEAWAERLCPGLRAMPHVLRLDLYEAWSAAHYEGVPVIHQETGTWSFRGHRGDTTLVLPLNKDLRHIVLGFLLQDQVWARFDGLVQPTKCRSLALNGMGLGFSPLRTFDAGTSWDYETLVAQRTTLRTAEFRKTRPAFYCYVNDTGRIDFRFYDPAFHVHMLIAFENLHGDRARTDTFLEAIPAVAQETGRVFHHMAEFTVIPQDDTLAPIFTNIEDRAGYYYFALIKRSLTWDQVKERLRYHLPDEIVDRVDNTTQTVLYSFGHHMEVRHQKNQGYLLFHVAAGYVPLVLCPRKDPPTCPWKKAMAATFELVPMTTVVCPPTYTGTQPSIRAPKYIVHNHFPCRGQRLERAPFRLWTGQIRWNNRSWEYETARWINRKGRETIWIREIELKKTIYMNFVERDLPRVQRPSNPCDISELFI